MFQIKDYSPYAINNSFKNSISKLIDKHYKGDYNAIMKAVLIGDKKEFSDDFDKILTKTGTKRYFYSSYLHIMLLMSRRLQFLRFPFLPSCFFLLYMLSQMQTIPFRSDWL